MICIFLDETSDSKYRDYFGISLVMINSFFYPFIKEEFQKILSSSGWDCSIEFKGSYLFSRTKGDPSIDIEKRIRICSDIIALNISKKNSRFNCYYSSKRGVTDQKNEYLKIVAHLLKKVLPKASSAAGKNILSVVFDERSDIKPIDLYHSIISIIHEKGYSLFEMMTMQKSGFETVGLLYADIIGYLNARIEVITNDLELFEGIREEDLENNGKILKLRSSTDLIEQIKNLKWINTN
ncbi:MAG: hypothetical protein HPY53_00760 [Brevinematales bacterium]|nr:hypothetical protein [Brevinematales bacterium]